MLAKRGAGPPRGPEGAAARSPARLWVPIVVAIVILVVVLLLTAAGPAPAQPPGMDAGSPPAVLTPGEP
jgi:hypothetical protein